MRDIKTIIAELEKELDETIKDEKRWVKEADFAHTHSHMPWDILMQYNLPRTEKKKCSLELHTTQKDLLENNRDVELENSLIKEYEEIAPLLNKYNENVEKYLKENFKITLDK